MLLVVCVANKVLFWRKKKRSSWWSLYLVWVKNIYILCGYYLSSLVSKWMNSVECVLSPLNLLLLLHDISFFPFHFFFQLNEQYCLAQTQLFYFIFFLTLVSSAHGIARRVLKIRLCGNVICWQIISRLVPVNLTRNESQEPFQHNYPRYGRNNLFWNGNETKRSLFPC